VNFHAPNIFNSTIESVSHKAAICFLNFTSKYENTSSFRQVASYSFLTLSAGTK